MKLLLLVLATLLLQTTQATNYYFSTSSGDDNRSAAEAQNPATPWKTINKLNAYFGNLRPGDVISFKRGDIFYGAIRPIVSGNSSQPITFNAFGNGAKPVVSGLTTLSNWTSLGNGIWESYNAAMGSTVNTVLLNNTQQQMGRYPNSNSSNKGYLLYEAHTNLTITDNDQPPTHNWTGAELVIRKLYWIMDRNLITAHNGNTFTFVSGSAYYPWQPKNGYFIQNDIRTLDQFGEWYYNPSTRKMAIFTGGTSPANYNIQVPTVNTLVNTPNISYLAFDNITFQGANVNAFEIRNSSNISITACDILNTGEDGIRAVATNNFRLENSYVSYSNNNGIGLEYQNHNAVLRYNKIENTHLLAGMGKSGDGNGIGMQLVGNNILAEYNEVQNSGYSGIFFAGNWTTVKNNFINRYCVTKDDGAGVYTNVERTDGSAYAGRKIVGNVIQNGIGNPEGLADGYHHAHGIYVDGISSGLEVIDNSISNNASAGIFCPNPNNVVITNNTIFNNRDQVVINHSIPYHSVINNTVTKNILFSKRATQMTIALSSIADDIGNFGYFNENYYARPFEDKMTLFNQYVNSAGTISEVYDLETWRAKYNKDGASQRSPIQFPSFIVNNLLSGNRVVNGTFNSNVNGVGGWTALNNMTIGHVNGALDGGSVQVSFTAAAGSPGTSLVTIDVGALTANKNYVLRFSLKGSNNNLSLGTYLRRNGGNWGGVTTSQFSKISTTRTENELVFSVPENEASAAAVFTVDNQNIQFWLDNIQFFEADVTITNPDDYILYESNGTNANKTIALPGTYIDVKNVTYSGSVTLAPYTSVVLMKTGSAASPPPPPADNTPPSILLRNATIYSGANGVATLQPSDIISSITDASGVNNSSIQLSQTQFNCAPAARHHHQPATRRTLPTQHWEHRTSTASSEWSSKCVTQAVSLLTNSVPSITRVTVSWEQ